MHFDYLINEDESEGSFLDDIGVNYNHYYTDEEELCFTLPDWYRVLSKSDNRAKKEFEKILTDEFIKSFRSKCLQKYTKSKQLPKRLKEAQDYYQKYFHSKVKYLGPLRGEPQWVHEPLWTDESKINPDTESLMYGVIPEVGTKGEKTIAYIYYLKIIDHEVDNYISPSDIDSLDLNGKNRHSKLFMSALNEWIDYMKIADKIKTSKLTKDSFTVDMIINEKSYDLPQLGTGVSQILPILVICLAAPVGSTIIIETPEEQLHPKLQSKLADFFIAMAASGRQCLIETHSEYIIEQIRYRIVKSPLDVPLHDDKIKLYFTSKQNGISRFKEIKTNEYAVLDEWPEDFFDESHLIIDKIMEAAIKKEEKRRKK